MSMLAFPGILQQQGAGGGAFNPETDITWHSFSWAEGTNFVARGIVDGGSVQTWDNETGESALTQATAGKRPLYRASVAALNGQPAIDFDGTDDILVSADFTTNPDYTSKVSMVWVGNLNSVSGTRTILDGNDLTNYHLFGCTSGAWWIRGSTTVTGGTAATGAHLIVAIFDAATAAGGDIVDVDNANVITDDAGNRSVDGWSVCGRNNNTNYVDGEAALAGIYEGNIKSDPEWSNFKTWVTSHYGITLS